MAEALCAGDVRVPARARAAKAAAALADSVLPVAGYGTKTSFPAGRMAVADRKPKPRPLPRSIEAAASGQTTKLSFPKAMRWWARGLQPNMREAESAQDLADTLRGAGDRLVVVDFFSPGCGGCRALHPKVAQFAQTNPEVLFLQVNYETHRSMCYSLHVHVLPFFRFYRGAEGRLTSFSCTNATIKKLKDALAKHGADRCSLGPARGLDDSELMALAANRDLHFAYDVDKELADAIAREAAAPGGPWLPLPASATQMLAQGSDNSSLLSSSSPSSSAR